MKFRILILLILLFPLETKSQGPKPGDLDFLVNVSGVKTLSFNEVVSIFKNGKSLWPNGQKVTIVLPSNKSEFAEKVASEVYGGSISSMQKFWLALVFQGRASPPVFLQTEEEIFDYVSKNPGSIGVVPKGHPNFPEKFRLTISR
jgi:ABC-type phosphate transport system substrate-binding protein